MNGLTEKEEGKGMKGKGKGGWMGDGEIGRREKEEGKGKDGWVHDIYRWYINDRSRYR